MSRRCSAHYITKLMHIKPLLPRLHYSFDTFYRFRFSSNWRSAHAHHIKDQVLFIFVWSKWDTFATQELNSWPLCNINKQQAARFVHTIRSQSTIEDSLILLILYGRSRAYGFLWNSMPISIENVYEIVAFAICAQWTYVPTFYIMYTMYIYIYLNVFVGLMLWFIKQPQIAFCYFSAEFFLH